MSGGVDSSAAVMYLQDRGGYDLIGVTLNLYDSERIVEGCRSCCSADDAIAVAAVCARLGIRHYVYNFKNVFEREVIAKFRGGYVRGETPNPCVDCNNRIKFKYLFDRAESLGVECLATGHYARIEDDNGWKLKRAVTEDGSENPKDQSYVLYGIPKRLLPRILFPLGGKSKATVRADALSRGFENHNKPDSQDICFVPDGDYAEFIRQSPEFREQWGGFYDTDGNYFMPHTGFINYTVGQRRGLGSFGFPAYVVRKDAATGNVYVGADRELYGSACTVRDVNWLIGEGYNFNDGGSLGSVLDGELHCTAKTRYKARDTDCAVTVLSGSTLRVEFAAPVRALTPGQHIVFYDGDTVLGGGVIQV
jgi:tRNA-specific 2-thiouridylase